MAESKTFEKAEETINYMLDGNRKVFTSLFEFQRSAMQTSLDFIYSSQIESIKMMDTMTGNMIDQVGKLQKGTIKNIQASTTELQKQMGQAVSESTEQIETLMKNGMEMAKPPKKKTK